MKFYKNILLLGVLAVLAGGTALADDFDDFGFDDFGSDSSSSGSSSSLPIQFSGKLSLDVRDYLMAGDVDGIGDTQITTTPDAKLGITYDGGKASADLQLKVNEDTIKNHPIDVIDELTLSAYLGNFTLSAGKMKVVWGKGDKLHVLDNFNADDYSDFIIPDYLDRRISTPMIRGVYAVPLNSRTVSNVMIEGVYTPIMPVDRFGSGVWTPSKSAELTSTVKNSATKQLKTVTEAKVNANKLASEIETLSTTYKTALTSSKTDVAAVARSSMNSLLTTNAKELIPYGFDPKNPLATAQTALEKYVTATETAYLLALNNSSSLAGGVYPDTNKFEYGQGGLRVTGTIGQVDLGISYYYGHYKQPSVNGLKMTNYVANYLKTGTGDDKFLAYDKKQTFGLEFSTILWKFNLRGEAAYNLTDDVAGDDPWVHNNSIQWLGGFDIDLPFWDANLNVQETGTYILKNDKIEDSIFKTADVDYASTGYLNNKLVVNFTTSFLNGKLAPEVTALYGFEHKDLVVMPKITIKPASSFKIIGSGLAMWTNDETESEFGTWHKNSFIQLGAEVSF